MADLKFRCVKLGQKIMYVKDNRHILEFRSDSGKHQKVGNIVDMHDIIRMLRMFSAQEEHRTEEETQDPGAIGKQPTFIYGARLNSMYVHTVQNFERWKRFVPTQCNDVYSVGPLRKRRCILQNACIAFVECIRQHAYANPLVTATIRFHSDCWRIYRLALRQRGDHIDLNPVFLRPILLRHLQRLHLSWSGTPQER